MVMESVIKYEIIKHLNDFNLINVSQHGFTKCRSCITNLLEFLKIIMANHLNVYADFAKVARMHHSRLNEKLKAYEIYRSVARWIFSW